jgi:hypothetical protein
MKRLGMQPAPSAVGRRACGLLALLVLGAGACTGQVSGGNEPGGTPGQSNVPGSNGAGGSVGGNGGTPPAPPPPPPSVAGLDVGRVGIHRLNNAEYDNTIRDLLGVDPGAKATFIPDEKALGFDNIASAFGMTAAQYAQYFSAGQQLSTKAFADEGLRKRIVTCTPAAANDTTCLRDVVKAFGLRAYRRPLRDDELTALMKVGTDALALGEDFNAAVRQVVNAAIVSLPFLYRIEFDPDPTSKTPRTLNSYELASRLSYLQWSTMPDDQLFGLAASGELLKEDVLNKQIDRMLADRRSSEFLVNFAGQWLGMRDLQGHQVEKTAFPDWDEPLREAMLSEGHSYFAEFLTGDKKLDEFFTADINFVDAKLGKLYGITGSGTGISKVTNTTDQRVGFLGLASFLTHTSFSYRTAPTLRGVWILENLLCEHIPPVPNDVPELDSPAAPAMMNQNQNVRVRLAEHRKDPACAGCHTLLDPMGLGLENFDAIGRYRETYPNGDRIDASGELPDGSKFNGLPALAALLGKDPRFLDCASEKLMTYALSRELTDADKPFLGRIRDAWKKQGLGARNLLKAVVLSDSFRLRRGEPTQ